PKSSAKRKRATQSSFLRFQLLATRIAASLLLFSTGDWRQGPPLLRAPQPRLSSSSRPATGDKDRRCSALRNRVSPPLLDRQPETRTAAPRLLCAAPPSAVAPPCSAGTLLPPLLKKNTPPRSSRVRRLTAQQLKTTTRQAL
ncbi:unnamed protein product, partial [Linum tenue]